MKEFKETDRFQKGDKATWYNDIEYKRIFGIVIAIDNRIENKEPVYIINVNGQTHLMKELALDKIPVTRIDIQKHGNSSSQVSIDSSEFFATITMATNYASEKLEELRTKGMKNLILSDPGLDVKIAKIKESYDYWENEYERLTKFRELLR